MAPVLESMRLSWSYEWDGIYARYHLTGYSKNHESRVLVGEISRSGLGWKFSVHTDLCVVKSKMPQPEPSQCEDQMKRTIRFFYKDFFIDNTMKTCKHRQLDLINGSEE